MALEPSGSAIVWQADGTIARTRPFGGGPDAWTGDTVVDVEAGQIEAPGLNDLIDAAAPAWATSSASDTARPRVPRCQNGQADPP